MATNPYNQPNAVRSIPGVTQAYSVSGSKAAGINPYDAWGASTAASAKVNQASIQKYQSTKSLADEVTKTLQDSKSTDTQKYSALKKARSAGLIDQNQQVELIKAIGEAQKSVNQQGFYDSLNPVQKAGKFIADTAVGVKDTAVNSATSLYKVYQGQQASSKQAVQTNLINQTNKEWSDFQKTLKPGDYANPVIKKKNEEFADKIKKLQAGFTSADKQQLKDSNSVDPLRTAADTAETFLNIATLGTGTIPKQMLKQGGKFALEQALKRIAMASVEGAAFTGAAGGINAIGERKDINGVLTDATTGAAVGGVLGGVLGAGGAAIRGIKGKIDPAKLDVALKAPEVKPPKITKIEVKTPKPEVPKVEAPQPKPEVALETPSIKPAYIESRLSEADYKELGITDANLKEAESIANDYIGRVDKASSKAEIEKIANAGYAELGELLGGTSFQKSLADAEVYRKQHLVDTGVERSGIDPTAKHQAPKITAQEQAARGQAEWERRIKEAGLVETPQPKPEVAQGKVEAPQVTKTPVVETKPAGIATATEKKAAAAGIETSPSKAEFATTSYKENKITAKELVKTDKQAALDIVEGKVDATAPQRQEAYKALETKAIKEADIQTIERLKNSTTASEASQAAQTLGQRGFELDPTSPVQAIKSIENAQRSAISAKAKATVAKDTAVMKKNIKVPTKDEWASFVEGLRC